MQSEGNMATHVLNNTNLFLTEVNNTKKTTDITETITQSQSYTNDTSNKTQIVWFNVIVYVILHALALYGVWLVLAVKVSWKTILFNYVYLGFAGVGVTGGAHRLWAHRAYKAKLPFRILLMLAQTASLQNNIYVWVRDHRVHHKYTDTDADPHNSKRGFFFSHVGWLLTKKHEEVKRKGKTIDMSDVASDPVVMWQRNYYAPLVLLLTFIIPTFIPWYFWGEVGMKSFYVCVARYVIQLNGTWSVNSAAHLWGYKPYDQFINPVENKYVSFFVFGEGWHNYHHTFPWDYKAAELGNYRLNWTTAVLDFMSYIGQTYDLRTVSKTLIAKRAKRTGDGSWKDGKIDLQAVKQKNNEDNTHEDLIWGWDDKDMKAEDKQDAEIINKTKDESVMK